MSKLSGLSLLASILTDVEAWSRDHGQSVEFAKLRTQYLFEDLGDLFFYEVLPSYGKAFDKALSNQRMGVATLEGGHSFPLDFLLRNVFDHHGDVLESPCVNSIFFVRQYCYMMKKVNAQCSRENILKAVKDFHKIEDEMRNPSLDWSNDRLGDGLKLSFADDLEFASNRKLSEYFQRAADVVSTMLPEINTLELVPRHGPGAVSDKRSGEDKFPFPYWPTKLDAWFPYDAFASHNLLQGQANDTYVNHEHPARLIAVPKTPLKPRLIASEPSYHQYCQQAVLRWVRKNCPYPISLCVSFRQQELSRSRALSASKDGLDVSIDLSSASDRLSCWAVERFFRRNPSFLNVLHSIRTRMLMDPISENPKFRILKKYANQGSAVTFPVQSIIYATACIAAILFEGNSKVNAKTMVKAARKVRVFGDDIILPKTAHVSTMRILNLMGFRVNMNKTHVNGYFRESCGMDAYGGHNVAPVYVNNLRIERTAEALSSLVDVSNNLHTAGLFHAAAYVRSRVLKTFKDASIPVTRRHDLGCVAFSSFVSEHFEGCRYNKSLQQLEVRSYTVSAREARGERENDLSLLQYFVEEPAPTSLWKAGYLKSHRTRLCIRWVPIAR